MKRRFFMGKKSMAPLHTKYIKQFVCFTTAWMLFFVCGIVNITIALNVTLFIIEYKIRIETILLSCTVLTVVIVFLPVIPIAAIVYMKQIERDRVTEYHIIKHFEIRSALKNEDIRDEFKRFLHTEHPEKLNNYGALGYIIDYKKAHTGEERSKRFILIMEMYLMHTNYNKKTRSTINTKKRRKIFLSIRDFYAETKRANQKHTYPSHIFVDFEDALYKDLGHVFAEYVCSMEFRDTYDQSKHRKITAIVKEGETNVVVRRPIIYGRLQAMKNRIERDKKRAIKRSNVVVLEPKSPSPPSLPPKNKKRNSLRIKRLGQENIYIKTSSPPPSVNILISPILTSCDDDDISISFDATGTTPTPISTNPMDGLQMDITSPPPSSSSQINLKKINK